MNSILLTIIMKAIYCNVLQYSEKNRSILQLFFLYHDTPSYKSLPLRYHCSAGECCQAHITILVSYNVITLFKVFHDFETVLLYYPQQSVSVYRQWQWPAETVLRRQQCGDQLPVTAQQVDIIYCPPRYDDVIVLVTYHSPYRRQPLRYSPTWTSPYCWHTQSYPSQPPHSPRCRSASPEWSSPWTAVCRPRRSLSPVVQWIHQGSRSPACREVSPSQCAVPPPSAASCWYISHLVLTAQCYTECWHHQKEISLPNFYCPNLLLWCPVMLSEPYPGEYPEHWFFSSLQVAHHAESVCYPRHIPTRRSDQYGEHCRLGYFVP